MRSRIHILIEKDAQKKTGVCAYCGKVRLVLKGKTLRCYKGVQESKRKTRKHISLIEWAEYKRMCSLCEICLKQKPLVVDHCHKTGKFRGALCKSCNLMLGLAKDSIEVFESAILYLKK